MKNNELKDNVLKNVKENIAVSNITKEIEEERSVNKTILIKSLTTCAAVILIGIFLINNNMTKSNENMVEQQVKDEIIVGKLESENKNDLKENDIEGNINSVIAKDEQDDFRGQNVQQMPTYDENETANAVIKENVGTDSAVEDKVNKVDVKNFIKNILEVFFSIF
ncbi:MAG: hypothetical protein IKJ32_05100 [Clostridia bacterium]|nr:hypothetical protein [Clostridia bacterium]